MSNSNSWANDGQQIRFPPDDILEALGEVVVLFNSIDMMLLEALSALMGARPNAAPIVFNDMPFGRRVDFARRLVRGCATKQPTKKLGAWLAAIKQLSEERNRLVHSQWHRDVDGRTLRIQRQKAPIVMESVNLLQLREIIIPLRKAYFAFIEVIRELEAIRNEPRTGRQRDY
jgi:hypothetical protein